MPAKKLDERARVVLNKEIADGIFWMSTIAPDMSEVASPGQFVHLRVVEHPAQLLRMPFAIYDAAASMGNIDIVYQVVGEGTAQLAELAPGDLVDLIGPIGNGWNPPQGTKRPLLIGGGVGTPALNLLARRFAVGGARVDCVVGALNAGKLCCLEHLDGAAKPSGGKVYVATDDGSAGARGFVTVISDELIASGDYDYVAICGPTPMMRNAARPALEAGVPCQVSMERLMACGVGACLSCVVDTVSGKRRCCVDGPVFEASEVVW